MKGMRSHFWRERNTQWGGVSWVWPRWRLWTKMQSGYKPLMALTPAIRSLNVWWP
jgi:hypothetical protein